MTDNSSSSSAPSESDGEFVATKSCNNKRTINPPRLDQDQDDNVLQINHKYARDYDARKRREELSNHRNLEALEAIANDDESEDSETEDEDGDLLTADLDVKIIKTLQALKRRDEDIYDPNVTFFSEQDGVGNGGAKSESHGVKPKRFKDVAREYILEDIDANERNEMEQDEHYGTHLRAGENDVHDLAYDQEQREIRRAFLESTRDDDEGRNEDHDEETWLKPKTKQSFGEHQQDNEVKRLWEEEFKSSNKSHLVDPKGEVQDGDKFLMEFMTSRKWVDTSDIAKNSTRENDDQSMESFQDRMDDFESKYNFRFEEAAAANDESGATRSIVHYARGSVGDNIIRRKDETRRQKRIARKERKAEERKAKEEQLRRLKNAKREELQERMQQVRNVLGYDGSQTGEEGDAAGKHSLGEAEEEMILKLMEGDYDPDKFEQVMSAAYGEDYYQQEDEKWKTDLDVKVDLIKGGEDGDVVGDGEMYDDVDEGNFENEEEFPEDSGEVDDTYENEDANWDIQQPDSESKMDKKLKSKMLDELYKLDYEDIIGDMPTRFKYRSVEPNSFGLSTEEILSANDTSLKQFVSLKKMAPYRDEGEYQPGTKRRKKFRQMLKSDVEEYMKGDAHSEANVTDITEGEETKPKKKRRRQKKGGKKTSGDTADDADKNSNEDTNQIVDAQDSESTSRKRAREDVTKNVKESMDDSTNKEERESKTEKKRNKKEMNKHRRSGAKKRVGITGVSTERLASYGI